MKRPIGTASKSAAISGGGRDSHGRPAPRPAGSPQPSRSRGPPPRPRAQPGRQRGRAPRTSDRAPSPEAGSKAIQSTKAATPMAATGPEPGPRPGQAREVAPEIPEGQRPPSRSGARRGRRTPRRTRRWPSRSRRPPGAGQDMPPSGSSSGPHRPGPPGHRRRRTPTAATPTTRPRLTARNASQPAWEWKPPRATVGDQSGADDDQHGDPEPRWPARSPRSPAESAGTPGAIGATSGPTRGRPSGTSRPGRSPRIPSRPGRSRSRNPSTPTIIRAGSHATLFETIPSSHRTTTRVASVSVARAAMSSSAGPRRPRPGRRPPPSPAHPGSDGPA